MKLVIAGGGTGGHLFPGIAVAEALRRIDASSDVLFIGTERGIEAKAVPRAGFRVEFIKVGGLKRVGLKKTIGTLSRLPVSLLESRRLLKAFGADAVLGVGGYASGPVVVAAKAMGLPTAVCEQNSVPGLTNRLLGKIVDRVFLTFAASAPHFPATRAHLVGNPVRQSFLEASQQPAAAFERGLVFVFGGSQGARPLNEHAPQALGILKSRGLDVRALHQAGASEVAAVEAAYALAGVSATVTPFIDEMVAAYRRAHVVVCRAGATSCAELTALGVPAILIPFPQAADDHQTLNARDLERTGACVLLSQSGLSPEALADALGEILQDDGRRAALAAAAKAAGHLDAGDVVAHAALQGFAAPLQPRGGST